MARAVACGVAFLAALFPAAALAALAQVHGVAGLLSLPPGDLASLAAGLFLPPCLLLLAFACLNQRAELAALRTTLLNHTVALDGRRLQQEALLEESRAQTALLQEQVRLALSELAVGKRQVEVVQALSTETRMQRLVAEWNLVSAELHSVMIAMWRFAHGWRTAEATELPLPGAAELPLAVLRLLPATPEEMARLEVEERFARQAARYRATFQAFLDRVPESGPLTRDFFCGLVQGRLDARLALLPRPNHARVIDPATLAAE